jgi:hypothetical protein
VSSPWEREDVVSIMAGVFDPNVKLDAIARNVAQIRRVVGDDDEEEELETEDD